ncbi:Reverse transcriptase, partial [Phytophthora palmivora]
MAVLPDVTATTEEVKIEDLQIGDTNINTQEEIERLVQIIWKRKHLLIGKGNALPPAAKGVVCDIDVGNAKPVAQRCRKVAIQFREKFHQLIKGLLSARMIRHSTSPWASPIVVIIKKNGIDIRLCIDYRLVNSLTRLMVYPMPLINDLLDDLDKVLWYCSLDMASGFWVVPMTDRAGSISAFITPFGLFEWNRMPFGLKNAPQIYQRLLDNALYGFVKVTQDQDRSDRRDVFETGEPDLARNESVLGRRSYIDDILVTRRSWDALCEKVEKLLDVSDEWNLSISVAKSFWGQQKVDYLGHRVSAEDFAIYASVLYELREADFYEIARKIKSTGDDEGVVVEEN